MRNDFTNHRNDDYEFLLTPNSSLLIGFAELKVPN